MDNISSQLSTNLAKDAIGSLKGGFGALGENKKGTQEADPSGGLINSFGSMLKNQMNNLNELSQNSAKAVEAYASGEPIEVHQVMLAMEKSSTAMSLAIQVRNKVISGYQELMRTQA